MQSFDMAEKTKQKKILFKSVAANKAAAIETVGLVTAASQNGFSTCLHKETNIIQKMKKHITFILSESSREIRSYNMTHLLSNANTVL